MDVAEDALTVIYISKTVVTSNAKSSAEDGY